MSKILTPNVFITNNAQVAKEFFLRNKYINVEDLPSAPDAIVISGKNNKYLQSLEYSVNFDNENNPSLTLEFLDTDGNFEQNMFMHLTNSVKSSLQSAFRGDGAKNTTPVKKQDKLGGSLTISDDSTRVGIREFDMNSLLQYANVYNRIFVAFGTDSLLSNWSDILVFYLNKTNIDVSNGLRKYTFKYYASNESIFRPKLKFNFEDPNFKREFLFLDAVDKLIVTIRKNNNVDTLENILYRLVKKYLSIITKTPEENIIGILPALGESQSVEDILYPGDFIVKPSIINYQNIKFYIEKLGIKEVNETQEFNVISQGLKKPTGVSITPTIVDAQQENDNGTSAIDSYMLVCNKEDSSINPSFPDFYEALNKINVGIKSILKTVDDFVIFQENNTKLLDFWRKRGLIGDAIDPSGFGKCIVFGPQQMISEYLYRNYIPNSSENAVTFDQYLDILQNTFEPTLKIYDSEDPLYSKDNNLNTNVAKILTNPTYGIDLISLISKRKTSSNFYEQANLDELAIDGGVGANFSELFKTKGGLFELFEIPVFLNNFKNSNILNIQFTNSEIYLNGLRLAINSNFSKAYLSLVANNANKVNIQGLNLSSVFDAYKNLLSGVLSQTFEIGGRKVGFKEALKTILVQQFYLAKDSEIDFMNEGEFKLPLFRQLKNVKPRSPSYLDLALVTITGGSRSAARLKFLQEIENEVKKRNGIGLISQDIVIKVLDALENLGGLGFDKLIYKSQGNINIDALLLSIAASKLQDNKTVGVFKERVSTVGVFKERVSSFLGEFIDTGGFEISKQEAYFNLANTLFTIFDIKTLDDNDLLLRPDGVVFSPKEFGLSQENIAAELWKQLNSQQIKLSIKTLPFFHLSNIRLVNFKPAFVFSKQVTPMNVNSRNNSTNLDFFSGIYNIAALKHVISTKECYSQFLLLKTVGNSYGM